MTTSSSSYLFWNVFHVELFATLFREMLIIIQLPLHDHFPYSHRRQIHVARNASLINTIREHVDNKRLLFEGYMSAIWAVRKSTLQIFNCLGVKVHIFAHQSFIL